MFSTRASTCTCTCMFYYVFFLQPPTGREASHELVVRSFDSPTKCDACTSVMFGLVRQGMMCKSKCFSISVIPHVCLLLVT